MSADSTRVPKAGPASPRAWIGAALLAVISLLAMSPGLLGSWVHDDLNMLHNPNYDDLSDVPRVVTRHSGVYAPSGGAGDGAMSQTYRPLTMLTLVVTHVLLPRPIAHHLLGWTLHALTAFLLWLALRRSDRRPEAGPAHGVLTAIFLLHPVTVESCVWINGRSDLVAGLCLTALLFSFANAARARFRSALTIFVLSLLGSGSKETFVPAALLTALAFTLRPVSAALASVRWKRRVLSELVPCVLGVAVYALARFSVLPPSDASLAGAGNPFASSVGWLFLPKLGAIASHALLSLRAATMQSLSWDLVRGLTVSEWLCAGIWLLWIVLLIRARDVRGLALTAAAAASLAPAALVVFAIWLGLDRYLYLPLILLVFAAAPHFVRAWSAAVRVRPLSMRLTAAAVLAVAAGNTFVASRAYHDQRSWLATLAQERPEDPTVVIFLAKELGPPVTRELLASLPAPPWPSSMIGPAIALANSVGQTELARRVAEYGVRSYRDNPLIVALALRQRYESGQHQAALDLLPALSSRAPVCREVKKQLGLWAARGSLAERDRLTQAAAALQCSR
jgi:hypothetical protein